MVAIGIFKKKVAKVRESIEQWKSNNPQANKLITKAIGSLPDPFNTFGEIVWEGLEKDDDGPQKMLELLEKIEKNNENKFNEISSKVSELIQKQPTSKEIQEVGIQIITSKKEVVTILSSKLDKLSHSIQKLQDDVKILKKTLADEKEENKKFREIVVNQLSEIGKGLSVNKELIQEKPTEPRRTF